MKSPCLHCGKPVAHLAYERPFCTVGCNADFAGPREMTATDAAWATGYAAGLADGIAKERKRIVAWLRSRRGCEVPSTGTWSKKDIAALRDAADSIEQDEPDH
jgi:hypothetical protein